MIASPCRDCPRLDQPKANCIHDCILLREIQDMQCSIKEDVMTSGIDDREEIRFLFNQSVEEC